MSKFEGQPNQVTPNTDEEQLLRQKRYQTAVERENNPEIRETIDIFETPLFFRKDKSIFAYLEYERSGGIDTSARFLSRITGLKIPRKTRNTSVYLEAPIPYEPYPGEPQSADTIAAEMAKRGMTVEKEKLDELLKKTTKLSTTGDDRQEQNDQEKEEKQNFLAELIKDPEFIKIWLFCQKMVLTGEVRNFDRFQTSGLYSLNTGNGRVSSFLISPKKSEAFMVAHMGHNDFMFEVLSTKKIDADEILGYLEYSEKDSGLLLAEKIKTEIKELVSFAESDGTFYHNQHLKLSTEESQNLQDIFLERLKELFPFQDFREETLVDDILSGLKKYIADKFDVDIETITVKEFIELIVKGMGIPIYSRNGDQLWPERKSHDQIAEDA